MAQWGGGDPFAFVHQFVDDWTACPIDSATMALLRHADKLTRTPGSVSKADIDGLGAAGWDDTAIHDATQVISYFNYINRVADGLGIDAEEGLPPFGKMRNPPDGSR